MSKTIAVINEKGGVGKTTSILEVAYHLGELGKSTLVIDLDSQENATKRLLAEDMSKINEDQRITVYDILIDAKNKVSITDAIMPASESWKNTLILPSDCRLATIEPHLLNRINKEHILKNIISKIKNNFDFILIDLSPLMNILTINALVAADYYLLPTDLSTYSQKGMRTIIEVANMLKETGNNSNLELLGVFITSFQKGGSIAVRALLEDLQEEYKEKLLPIKIPDSVKVLESQRINKPVSLCSADCSVAMAYKDLAKILSDVRS